MKKEKKLHKYRKKIDIIDNAIFNLIKKRTKIVKNMLYLKKNKKDIVDKKRMNLIFKNIKRKSIKNNIDPKITIKIWKSIIWSYIEYQKRNFKKK
jgi:chorismate mutase